jgi:glycosyltransferase involved in cell wall biosynthesis
MNIAFHSNQLGIRGTEVALYDYALYNEEILQNKSFILSQANADLTALNKFKKKFDVFLYNNFQECEQYVTQHNITHVYYIKAGDNDGKLLPNVKNLIHVVFQNNDKHGEKYAYVSEWLANKMGSCCYVPHIVSLPTPTQNYRKTLNIPEANIVLGRYGGETEFDIPFVHQAIYDVINKRNDLTFVFMNTKQFGPAHPNIIFVNSTHNLQHKSNFIDSCDYMIHARNHGESFGLAICEFLHGGKPVISWSGGLDQHHTMLLKDTKYTFNSYSELYNLLFNLKHDSNPNDYKTIVQKFSPENVMNKFKETFLT